MTEHVGGVGGIGGIGMGWVQLTVVSQRKRAEAGVIVAETSSVPATKIETNLVN